MGVPRYAHMPDLSLAGLHFWLQDRNTPLQRDSVDESRSGGFRWTGIRQEVEGES